MRLNTNKIHPLIKDMIEDVRTLDPNIIRDFPNPKFVYNRNYDFFHKIAPNIDWEMIRNISTYFKVERGEIRRDIRENKLIKDSKYYEYKKFIDAIQQAEDAKFQSHICNEVLVRCKEYLKSIIEDQNDFCICSKCGQTSPHRNISKRRKKV
jgi:hypothetical protein